MARESALFDEISQITCHGGRGRSRTATASSTAEVYVDIEDKAAIAVIDGNAMKMVGKYDVSSRGAECAGLALDAQNGILFAARREKNNMVILSTADGHTSPTCPLAKAAMASRSIPQPWRQPVRRAMEP